MNKDNEERFYQALVAIHTSIYETDEELWNAEVEYDDLIDKLIHIRKVALKAIGESDD